MKYSSLSDMMSNLEQFIKSNPDIPIESNDDVRLLTIGFRAKLESGEEETWVISLSNFKDLTHLTGEQHELLTNLLAGKK